MADEEIIETATGLGYVDLVEGTGPRPKTGETVRVHYTGWLKSGQKFDSSHDRGQPLTFPIGRGRVIKGWDEGVGTMKVGGKRKLVIPAHLGYGAQGAGGVIPPGATLIFEVELLGIEGA
jgi:peptidylprolyl isomerase